MTLVWLERMPPGGFPKGDAGYRCGMGNIGWWATGKRNTRFSYLYELNPEWKRRRLPVVLRCAFGNEDKMGLELIEICLFETWGLVKKMLCRVHI